MEPHDAASDKLDVRWLLTVFNRRRGLFLSVFALVVAAVVLLTVTSTPKYVGVATVTIDSHQLPMVPSQTGPASVQSEATDSGAVSTQVEILTSRNLADRVVRLLDLDHNPEYSLEGDHKVGLRGRIMASVRQALHLKTPQKQALTPDAAHQEVIDEVLGRLEVARVGLSYVISIGYTDPDPELAAKIANNVC